MSSFFRPKRHPYDHRIYDAHRGSLIKEGVNYLRTYGLKRFLLTGGKVIQLFCARGFRKIGTIISYVATLSTPAPAILFQGERIRYMRRLYNTTWRNERTIEIPIILKYLEKIQGARILEVGNVLGHYVRRSWDVVDKYEREKGVIVTDILDFFPEHPYDVIFRISTIEHIGIDEEDKEEDKAIHAIKHLEENCLSQHGTLLMTMPLGYNLAIDDAIRDGTLALQRSILLQKGWSPKCVARNRITGSLLV